MRSSPSRGTAPTRPQPHADSGGGGGGSKKPRAVPAIAREVVSSLLSRATGGLNPSLIKETIVRKEPDFDERDHGFPTFSRLLEAMEKEGLLKRQQQGRQWYVVSVDGGGDPVSPGPSPRGSGTDPSADHSAELHEPEEESIPDPDDDDLAL